MAAIVRSTCSIPQHISSAAEARQGTAVVTDEVLAAAAQDGDVGAFDLLAGRHYRFCLATAYSIVRNYSDADDEVQNAFVKAWIKIRQYKADGSFRGWLYRIVSNQCRMLIRQRRAAKLLSVDQAFSYDGSLVRLEFIDQGPLPEEEIGDSEVLRVIFNEIHRVPPLLREPLIQYVVHKRTMLEIAQHLNISRSAAKSRLFRARIELEARLTKHEGENGSGTLFNKPQRHRTAYVPAN